MPVVQVEDAAFLAGDAAVARRFQVLASRRRARHVLEAVVAELGAKLPPLCLGALYGSNHHESTQQESHWESKLDGSHGDLSVQYARCKEY